MEHLSYFLKRVSKPKNLLISILWLVIVFFFFVTIGKFWPLGRQSVEVEIKYEEERRRNGPIPNRYKSIDPKINNTNDFFACVFPNLIVFSFIFWTWVFSPISFLFYWQIDDFGQEMQSDGTDLFFLSTEIPTNRKLIFKRKVIFLTKFFLFLHLILFALPISLLQWKAGYFSNFTGLQTFLFLACSLIIIPLLFFVPLVILLFSLASLKSVWYDILKWFGRLSLILFVLLGSLIYYGFYHGGKVGKKILEWGKSFSNWLGQHYLLTTLTILGVIIFLALFTLSLAYRDFQKKDLN